MIHWDDIAILRAIDAHEQQTGHVYDAPRLMRELAAPNPIDEQSQRRFVHELLLARDAGFIDFRVRQWVGQREPRPDDSWYLQQVDDLCLTLPGRDRARGRVVEAPLPNPDEDDGRMIAGLVLRDVAGNIAEVFSADQLPIFLSDSGIPDEYLEDAPDNVDAVYELLASLLNGGSGSRRILRGFLGSWLANRLHAGPTPEQRSRTVASLARQGWHLRDDNLVVGDRVLPDQGGGDSQTLAMISSAADSLHSSLQERVRALFDSGHRPEAVFEAFKLVIARVHRMSKIDDDGAMLMSKAFKGDQPPLPLNSGRGRSDKDEQEGFRFIFMGAATGIRNPKAHDPAADMDTTRAMEYLFLASLLMRRLDDVEGFLALRRTSELLRETQPPT